MGPTKNPESRALAGSICARLPVSSGVLVALSGGMDSVVLLHALIAEGRAVRAMHINHGLHADAPSWERFCIELCGRLGVPLVVEQLDAATRRGNVEAWAREARYAALAGALQSGEVLVTAQHASDQAETVLLALMRGSGLDGVSGMAADSDFGKGRLCRPMLHLDRAQLYALALDWGLTWVTDPSNDDAALDRGLLRQQVFPALRARWPAAERAMARSAALFSQARGGREEELQQWLPALSCGQALRIEALLALTPSLRAELLRYWLRERGFALPSSKVMASIESDLLAAAVDRQPLVSWGDCELRRYRGLLHALRPLPPMGDWTVALRSETGVAWPAGGEIIVVDLPPGWGAAQLQARRAQGGEMLIPHGQEHRRRLSRLFQEAGVPPWERVRAPLIWRGAQLVAVAGLCNARDTVGLEIVWNQ